MRADLHIHSVYSDGKLFPEELAKIAEQNGLSLVSFTDHDTLFDQDRKRAAAKARGLRYVSGWEVSAYDGCKIHVLGYGCKENGAYQRFQEKLKEGARARLEEMREKGNALLHVNVTMEDAEAQKLSKDAALHTMHLVRAFSAATDIPAGELYINCFSFGKAAYSPLGRPTPEEAVEAIRASGGFSSLAHPGRIDLDSGEREKLFRRLVSRGLNGIECYYTTHTVTETEYFLRFARGHGLLVTGGSDFHETDGVHEIGSPFFTADETLLAAISAHGGDI